MPDRNGKIFCTSIASLSHISKCGRFVTEDPSKHSSNWYSYCDNNPVTQADRTGLRPTTDGSAGSDEIANDYMIATYYKQQASAHPEMTQPAPEPPKTTRGKWSKNTFKTELPINFRYYNVDRTEFEPPFSYTDEDDNIIDSSSSDKTQYNNDNNGILGFIRATASNLMVDKMADVVTGFLSRAFVRHSVLEASKAIDDFLRFTPVVGVAIDAGLRVVEGEDIHHAVNKALITSLIVFGILAAVASFEISIGLIIAAAISAIVDFAVSYVYDRIFVGG